MKILIIGGSRFVGPLVVNKLLEKNHDVVVFNRGKSDSEKEKLDYKKIQFIQGDRNEGFNKIKNEIFDVIIDTCAFKGEQIKKSIDKLKFDYYLNFSTVAVYKKTDNFPLKEESEVGDWPFWGDYNKGKVECENILKEESIKKGFKYANIRPVYILGKNNYPNREPSIYRKIYYNNPPQDLILPGKNGEERIHFVFAEDVAKAMVLLAEKQPEGNFNCCGDESTIVTLNKFVNLMMDVVGKTIEIKYEEKLDKKMPTVKDFPFSNEEFYCKNDKIKKELGVNFTPLFEGLKRDYDEYYKNII